MKKLNRFLRILLSLTLVLSCFSGTAFAATEGSAATGDDGDEPYAISSLYVVGSSETGSYQWLNGFNDYTISDYNLMTDRGDGTYQIEFLGVPGGLNYEFKIAMPASYGTYEFGLNSSAPYYPPSPGYGETYYALDFYGDPICLDLEAEANICITVDTTYYDPVYGMGMSATVGIEYIGQRYALQCCDDLNAQFWNDPSYQNYPYLNMVQCGDHYEYTFYDLPQTSQMLWCYILPIDNDNGYGYMPSYTGSEPIARFKVDPEFDYYYEAPYATISYYPYTQEVNVSGVGIITSNSLGFSTMILETSGNGWLVNGNHQNSFQMEQYSYDYYDNTTCYEVNLYGLEPHNYDPNYPNENYYPGEDYYEFFLKTDSAFDNILACDEYTATGYEFTNNGLQSSMHSVELHTFSDLGYGVYLPRFRLTTKSDVRITVRVYDDPSYYISNIQMDIEITPTAPVCIVSGTENLIGESWSTTPSGVYNAMDYSNGVYSFHSRYLENVGEIYEFVVIERYMNEITWHGYNQSSYTDNTYNYPYDPYEYQYGHIYGYPGNPLESYGVHPYRFILTEPGYVSIYMDENTGTVNIYGSGITMLAPYEFTNLYIWAGRYNGSSPEGLYPGTPFELTTMNYNGSCYSIKFDNVPAGESYWFSFLADPNYNFFFDPGEYYSYDPIYQFELSAPQWDTLTVGSETVYFAEPGHSPITFDLEINSDVEITFDYSNYDPETGTGGIITLRITPIMGDVNGDGVVDITDATALQYYLAQLEDLTPAQQANADVDGDGQLSIKDVTVIQKYLAGMIAGF